MYAAAIVLKALCLVQTHCGSTASVSAATKRIQWPGISCPLEPPTGIMDTPCSKHGLSRPGACGSRGVCVNHPEVGRKAGHCTCPADMYGQRCERLGSLIESPKPVVVFSHFQIAGFEEFRGDNQDESVFITTAQIWWEDSRLRGVLEDGVYMGAAGDIDELKEDGLLWIPEVSFPAQDPPMIRSPPQIINATLKTGKTASNTTLLYYEAYYRVEKHHATRWHTFPFDAEPLSVHMQLTTLDRMLGIDAVACCDDPDCGIPDNQAGTYTYTSSLKDAVKAKCSTMQLESTERSNSFYRGSSSVHAYLRNLDGLA